MQLTDYVDCLIPRGGPSLIQSIRDNATVPVIIDGDGNCHVYVDAAADLDEALDDRRQRQDAAHRACATRPSRSSCTRPSPTRSSRASPTRCTSEGVELVGDDASAQRARRTSAPRPTTTSAASSSTSRCRSRSSPTSTPRSPTSTATAPATPRRSSPRDLDAARRFTDEVDAAAVIVNASTRFTDGEEFGFGAEIGISTQKLHARGPMGLRELTTYKYVVWGDGQIVGDPRPNSRSAPVMAERFASVPEVDRTPARASTTSPTPTSPASCSSPTGSRSRCSSRARPASARPSSPRRSPRSPARG